jgi:hypothetical protein
MPFATPARMHAFKLTFVCAVTVSVVACDFGKGLGEALGQLPVGVACGFRDSLAPIGAAVKSAEGGLVPAPLVDDGKSGKRAVQAACAAGDCSPHNVVVGTTLELSVDFSELAPGTDGPFTFTSSDDDIIVLKGGDPVRDPCTQHLIGNASAEFANTGSATLIVARAGVELMQFTFEVFRPSSLDLTLAGRALAQGVVIIENQASGTRLVRGGPGAAFSVQTRARDAMGKLMLSADQPHLTIDDTNVAKLVWPPGHRGSSGDGWFQGVQVGDTGRTTLHAELGGVTDTIDIEVDATLSTSDADAGAP